MCPSGTFYKIKLLTQFFVSILYSIARFNLAANLYCLPSRLVFTVYHDMFSFNIRANSAALSSFP
jgi:hypothetical protein